MARTAQEIFDTLIVKKNADANLQGMTSTSQTAIWRLFLWLFARASSELEMLYEAHKSEINQIAAAAQVGNVLWYRNQILQFQYGDNLVLVGEKYTYNVIDDSKKIVKRCVVEETTDSLIRVKAAKLESQNLVALSSAEISALTSYVKKIRFAGTGFQIFSNNGDQLKIGSKVYYDPIVPLTTVKPQVEDIVKNYVSNLPFNGELVVTNLIDNLQKIDGIKDAIFTEGASRFSPIDSYKTFQRSVIAIGGHFKISTAQGETLNDLIQYIENY